MSSHALACESADFAAKTPILTDGHASWRGGINTVSSGHRDGNGPVTIVEWNAAAKKIKPEVTVGRTLMLGSLVTPLRSASR